MAEYVTSCFGMAPEGSEVLASRWTGFQDLGGVGLSAS